VLETIGRWWNDWTYLHDHAYRIVPEREPRFVLWTEHWYNDFVGTRAWCDGRRGDCLVCFGRCCACAHTER
jgi:hypothetical protein